MRSPISCSVRVWLRDAVMIARVHALSEQHKGVLFNVCSHLVWGGMAVYFGFMRHIPSQEIAINRGLWSLPLAAIIVWWLGQWRDVWTAIKTPKHLAILALTGCIILFNWGFYVWSIQVGRALESSLGYFINPLLNVIVGYLFLGERFTRAQIVAIGFAAAGVIVQTVATGVFPWLGLALGASFCLYGFLRKTIPVGPTQGFMVETLVIAIPLLIAEAWLIKQGTAHLGANFKDTALLWGCGIWTTSALVFFAASLKRIRYSTAGILQYISPTLIFLIAILMFGEHLSFWKAVSFVLIWIGLAIYSFSALREDRLKVVHSLS
jgi:chloramphenicol-sensitive protein RarD